MKKEIISPVAIDLGANNTGVYSAHYKSGSSLDEIDKEGRVYHLERDSYTLLMAKRTASRHQRRGYDRRRMAKRLFKLIWEKHFGLSWNKEVQQTISFLLNRRGFSFLTEEHDAEVLSSFPQEVYDELPQELRKDVERNEEGYNFAGALVDWVQDQGVGFVERKYRAMTERSKAIKRDLLVIGRSKTLKEYCEKRINGDTIEEEKVILGRLSRWILDEWKSAGVKGLETVDVERNNVDMVTFLNKQSPEQARIILDNVEDYSERERELKSSLWNFDAEKFDLEKAEFGQDEPNVKTHLNHLAFAIHKTLGELQSGGRHRSKYFQEIGNVFEEVGNVLKTNKKHKTSRPHGYLRHFYEELASGGYKGLDVKTLANLIGNISNLELKPLRKYFNDKKHRRGDYWDEERLSEKFENWILREWRVNPQKDKLKAPGKDYDYGELRNLWKNRSGTVVDFWLNTDPNWTVPPYQDNNNRRPPRCQSLILSPAFLDENYKEWETWLRILKGLDSTQDYLEDYENQFSEENLTSGKGRSYFGQPDKGELKKDSGKRSGKHLNARVFQFILDRVKAEDPLNLNEIYSHAKKYRQNQSTSEEKKKARKLLEQAIGDSCLPSELRTKISDKDEALFASGTFLHLVCRYYKTRQKARDGRIFIHPEYLYVKGRGYENTGRFDAKSHLLTYCNHKPRQKRYQVLGDLAALLQVSPQDLEQLDIVRQQKGDNINEKLLNWLEAIDTLKTNCTRAAKEQKERRGRLKLDVQKVFGLVYYRSQNESPSNGEIRKILKDSKVEDAFKFYSFCKRAVDLCLSLTQNFYTEEKQKQWKQDMYRNPATAVYLLAQINNVVFKERSGNSDTCSVCTMDNAQRMQTVKSRKGKRLTSKAQRLPAISTRLIDGAVKRMARIVGGAIADEKWEKIKDELNRGNRVCIPIITESNRFEFEPSLKTLKGRPLGNKDKKYRETDTLADKDRRIEQDSNGICPYTGESISQGDKDHIIPRSSNRGTLNDEANLIWASEKGNKEVKKDEIFRLRDLNPRYKRKQFGPHINPVSDEKISEWIVEQIGDGETDEFKFGKYRSFINLSPDEQKAFRHALFLDDDHPLREQVISAIDNRTRTLVNGTQRYFAQTLADNLYKEAKSIGKERQISFDFFGVDAQSNTRGDGIRDLRSAYEEIDGEISEYAKKKGTQQKAYSHLIDAQLAFVMIADAHRNEGSLGLTVDDSMSTWPFNKDTGEVLDNIFDSIKVKPEEMKQCNLARRKPDENFSSHRAFTRDTFYADRYLQVLLQKSEDGSIVIRVGFDLQNSAVMRTDTKAKSRRLLTNLVELLPFCKETQQLAGREYDDLNDLFTTMEKTEYFARQLRNNHYCYLTVNKLKLHEYWAKSCNTKNGKPFDDKAFAYQVLRYTTEKMTLEKPEDLSETSKNDKKFTWGIQGQSVTLPVKRQWESCLEAWRKSEANGESFEKFLRSHFSSSAKHSHQKARKVFSLPVLTGQGKFMLRRKSWQGDHTFQIVNDSDSRGPDNKPNVPVRLKDGSMGIKLAKWARSENIVKFPSREKYQDGETVNPTDWYAVDKDRNSFPDGIDQIWYRIDDSTAPSIAVKLARDGGDLKPEFMDEDICKHGFRKQKEKKATGNSEAVPAKTPEDVRNEFFEEKIAPAKLGDIVCYKAQTYNKAIREAFKTAKKSKLE